MADHLKLQISFIGGFNMIKRFFSFILYLISITIVSAIFCLSYYALSNSFPIEEINDGESFHNLPKDCMDVIVLGSSHAQYSFSPAYFYQDSGLYSYVLGSPCQPLSISYNMLKEALKTQSPSVVVLEVFTAMPMKTGCDGVVCYIEAGFQMRGEEKYNTLKYLPKEKQEVYLNPFFVSHNNWIKDDSTIELVFESAKKSIIELFNEKETNIDKVSQTFGYVENYPSYPVENSWYATKIKNIEQVELEEEDQIALDNIKDLCDANGIELLLYKTPIDSLDDINLSYLEKVWEWAKNNEIPYIDLIEKSEEIDFQLCIQSSSYHSYINGASLVTAELANYIVNNFETKHIQNDNLENKYIDYSNGLTMSYLECEYDASKYLNRLMNYKGPILIRYGKEKKYNRVLKSFLEKYNINNDSIYFYDGNTLVDFSETCIGIEYKGHNIYCDDYLIEIDGEVFEENGELSIVIFSEDIDIKKLINTNTNRMWKYGYSWYGE